MEKKAPCGYAGKIVNSGSQVVEAPFAQPTAKKGKKVVGKDLRAGKNSK